MVPFIRWFWSLGIWGLVGLVVLGWFLGRVVFRPRPVVVSGEHPHYAPPRDTAGWAIVVLLLAAVGYYLLAWNGLAPRFWTASPCGSRIAVDDHGAYIESPERRIIIDGGFAIEGR